MTTKQKDNKLELDKQICHSLYSASNALVRAYRPLLEPLDITYPQYVVMMSLWQNDSVNVKQLSTHTRLDPGTLTPLLKRLETKSLLSREFSTVDERHKVISLTTAGRELKRKAKLVPDQMVCKTKMIKKDALLLKRLCDLLVSDLSEI